MKQSKAKFSILNVIIGVAIVVAFFASPYWWPQPAIARKAHHMQTVYSGNKRQPAQPSARTLAFLERVRSAKALLREQQFSQAEREFSTLLNEGPGYHEGWLRLSQARIGLNNHAGAKEALARYLGPNPYGGGFTNVPDPLLQALQVAELLNDGGILDRMYRRIIERTEVKNGQGVPTHLDDSTLSLKAKALASLGAQHRSSMAPGNGIPLFERAISMAPANPILHFEFGMLLSQLGNEHLDRVVGEFNLSKSLWVGRGEYPHGMELTRSNAARYKSSRDRWLSKHPEG